MDLARYRDKRHTGRQLENIWLFVVTDNRTKLDDHVVIQTTINNTFL